MALHCTSYGGKHRTNFSYNLRFQQRQQILLGTFFCSAHWPACGRDLNAAIRISLWLCHKLVNSYSEDATYSVYINGEHKRMTASAMIISNRLMFESQPHQLYGIIDNEQSRTSLG